MRTVQELQAEFVVTYRAEHGSVPEGDVDFLDSLLDRAFPYEGHVTYEELEALIMGVEAADGDFDTPEELATRFPLLNLLALYGLAYDRHEVLTRFEAIVAGKSN